MSRMCVCGHGEALHDISTLKASKGQRTDCSVMTAAGQCSCRSFVFALSRVLTMTWRDEPLP